MTDQFPDDWKTQIAGDSEDNLKSLEGFDSPVALGAAYFEQSVATKAAADANWRDPFVGDDTKYGKRMEKFTTQEDYGKSYREMETLISAGNLLKPLPADPTDADVTAYREQQGIPLEVSGYLENLPDGLVIGDDDKPIVEDLLNKLHQYNPSPDLAHGIIAWYNDFQEQHEATLKEQDKAHEDEATDALRETWKSEYRININIAKGALANLPEEKREMFLDARMSDNRALFNDPDIMRWLAGIGRQINPTATIVGAGPGDTITVDARLEEIRGKMGTPEYIKSESMQAEYRNLLEVKGKRKAA